MRKPKLPRGMFFDPAQIPTSLMEPSNEAGQSGGILNAPHSPEDVRDGLARCYLRHGADRPQWLADLAMPVVRMALEERDAEIKRLRDAVEGLRLVRAMHVCGEDERPAVPGEPPGALF